jgi:hypothetical protein
LKIAAAGHAIWKDVASEGKLAVDAASGGTSCEEVAFAHGASSSSSGDFVSADSVVEDSAAEDCVSEQSGAEGSVVAGSGSGTLYTELSQGFSVVDRVPNAHSWPY